MIPRTSLEEELAELGRWKLRPEQAQMRIFERLTRNEFQAVGEHRVRSDNALANFVHFAASRVPYYRDLFSQRALRPDAIRGVRDLPRLPVLKKQDVIERAGEMRAGRLPDGEEPPVVYSSTGTTGQPVTVLMSRSSSRMFAYLWHRQARWFRFDPKGCFAKIRIPSTLPRQVDGSPMPKGVAMRRDGWTYLTPFFETGPEVTFSISEPVEKQIGWLRHFRPSYMLAYPGVFEELALACDSAPPVSGLKALLGIGSTATPSMRAWIERVYGIPLEQNYGLNEIGMVAIRCVAGRYHVNTETCLVEIVDREGQPCAPGTRGHVLVTSLQNIAMPLIRYDTGDIALAVDGPCPCGRTLPSFGEIAGRYRRYAGLPAGTRERVRALQQEVEAMPPELVRNLRRYQVYQDAENRFEVRVKVVGPLPPEFEGRLRERWKTVCGDPPRPLAIIEGATILSSPGGKRLDFDSALYARDDSAALARAETVG